MEELREAFAEGISYVTREGWIEPADIPDATLREQYQYVVQLCDEFDAACGDFEAALYAEDEDNDAEEE